MNISATTYFYSYYLFIIAYKYILFPTMLVNIFILHISYTYAQLLRILST